MGVHLEPSFRSCLQVEDIVHATRQLVARIRSRHGGYSSSSQSFPDGNKILRVCRETQCEICVSQHGVMLRRSCRTLSNVPSWRPLPCFSSTVRFVAPSPTLWTTTSYFVCSLHGKSLTCSRYDVAVLFLIVACGKVWQTLRVLAEDGSTQVEVLTGDEEKRIAGVEALLFAVQDCGNCQRCWRHSYNILRRTSIGLQKRVCSGRGIDCRYLQCVSQSV